MTSNTNKVAIITGASSGIGKATKELLRSKGAIVYNLDVMADENDLPHYFVQCDVRKRGDIKAAVDKVFQKENRIDWLFANAGVHLFANIEETSDDEFDNVVAINIYGSFYTVKYVLPYMKQQNRGSIVLMGSDQTFTGKGQSSVYGLTKGAIGQFTKSTAIDYAKYNIRVNCVCPGSIDTPLLQKAAARYASLNNENYDDVMVSLHAAQPWGRLGRPGEIASVVAFLLSDENSFMTGSLVSADGGYVCQ